MLFLLFALILSLAASAAKPEQAAKDFDGTNKKGQTITYIVSFPKSGRTWLRLMLGEALNRQYNLKAGGHAILELQPLTKLTSDKSFPDIRVDHAKGMRSDTTLRSFDDAVVPTESVGDLELYPPSTWKLPALFPGKQVILLMRDPRDVFVSNWYEKKYRKLGLKAKENHNRGFTKDLLNDLTVDCSWIKRGAGLTIYLSKFEYRDEPYCDDATGTCSCFHPNYTIYDFMREPMGGFDTVLNFPTFFWKHRNDYSKFLIVRYEDLRKDSAAELKRIFSFLNVDVDEQHIKAAAEAGSFEQMREAELNGKYGWRLTARNKNDTATYKTREGKIGGFVEYFDTKTLQMMELQMKQVLPKETDLFGYEVRDL